MTKYYVYIIGKKVPYIIRGTSEQDIRNDWEQCTDCVEIIDHIVKG